MDSIISALSRKQKCQPFTQSILVARAVHGRTTTTTTIGAFGIASSPGSQEGGGERERRAWYYTVLLMLQFLTTMTNFDSG